MKRTGSLFLGAVAATLILAGQPAIAENSLAGSPEGAAISHQPQGTLRDEFQADMERALDTGTQELAIGAQIQALRQAAGAGEISNDERDSGIAALDALEGYYDAAQAASAALPPEHRTALQRDWEAATTLQGRLDAIKKRIKKLQDRLDEAEDVFQATGGQIAMPAAERARLEAAIKALESWQSALETVITPVKQAANDEPDRRQGDARSQIDRQNLIGDLRTRGGIPGGRPPVGQGTMAVRPPVQPPRQGPIILRIPGQ